jgi:hypothetical protein
MKRSIIAVLASALMALPFNLVAQSYTAKAGVSLLTGISATATATGQARLPDFSGSGTLNITGVGITGSPSGCTVTLAYQQNNAVTAGAVVSTTSFTPAVSVQQFGVAPTVLTGDNYVAVFACSTYPTAGTLNISFSPAAVASFDPCLAGAKKSFAISIASAGTTQLVALSTGKSIYVCGFIDGSAGTTPSVELEYGTGSSCGTGTTALTGPVVFVTSTVVNFGAGGATITSTPVSNALCAVTVGATHEGVLTYVQQ